MSSFSQGPAAGASPEDPSGVPASCARSADTAVFNRELALKRCFGKVDILREMAECFFSEVDLLFPQMRSALQKEDLVEVGRLGHRMKGTVVYLGAESAKEAALRVEYFETHPGIQAEAEDAVNALENQCKDLRSALGAIF